MEKVRTRRSIFKSATGNRLSLMEVFPPQPTKQTTRILPDSLREKIINIKVNFQIGLMEKLQGPEEDRSDLLKNAIAKGEI